MEERRTWARGKKPLTPEQKIKALNWNKTRVKIANMVARKKELDKSCCICGNPGNILHNKKNPYNIAFICDECRKDPEKLKEAENLRFDIRSKLNLQNLNITNYTKDGIKTIVEDYIKKPENKTKSIGEYCKQIGLSRYQFNIIIEKYEELYPSSNMKEQVRNRFRKVQRERLHEASSMRNLLNKNSKLLEE